MTPTDEGHRPTRASGAGKSHNSYSKRGRRYVGRISLGVLGLAIAALALGVLLAHQVSSVRTQLEDAVDLVPQLSVELKDGNHQAAKVTFQAMQERTSAARTTTGAPLWKAASVLPVYGANFHAVREVAVSADDIAIRAAAPLLDRYDSLNWQTLSPTDGRVDFTQLQEAAPDISSAATTVRLSHQRMSSIDLSRLLPELATPVGVATEQLKDLSALLDTAASTAQLLPAMLGSEGPRDYLVLVQNSSEARATGGIPGALAILHTDNGQISLGKQTSAVALGAFHPMLDVDAEQVAIYTGRLGTQMQNVNLTPDFPTAAQTAKQMWEHRHPGQIIDGVLALDPVVLAHLLDATGPVELTDTRVLNMIQNTGLPSSLTKDNVIPTLLSNVYREIENPEIQDAYFAAVASLVFSAFTDGEGDGARLIKALVISSDESRLRLWSSHSNEQSIVASTPLHGSVTGPANGGAAFGAYFNDGTGAKMDYYARRSIELLQHCQSGDYGEYTVRLSVTNMVQDKDVVTLPAYVTGNGAFGVAPGRIRTNYVVYGPAQSFVETATVNGEPVSVGSGKHGQRPVGSVQMEVGPNETAVLDITFSHVVQGSDPRVQVTPTIQSPLEMVRPFDRFSCN
ncbi:DUF4012 domain-containing protein [Arthrobacter sp. G119Y2]|uniref:DUF4012 domain-containing protein n=1 Tax=Arthrobacter sp. G119Y2 TaxID=3134965 RepID=UPI003119B68A